MTREEKTSRLKDILSEIDENDNAVCYLTSEDNELIESAIEALEQESCEDAISRKEALEALKQEEPLVWCDGADEIAAYNQWSSDVDTIKNMPPVQPKPKTGQWVLLDECSNSGYYCSECHKKLVKEGYSDTVKKIKYCPNCGRRMVDVPDTNDGKLSEIPTGLESEKKHMKEDRLDKTISDIAYILDNLCLLRQIYKTGDCNNCKNRDCGYMPKPGQLVRYNCPFYKAESEDKK